MKWKERFRNKNFWLSLAAAFILLFQQLGLSIVPDNAMDIVNTVLLILTIVGVVVDHTTPGLTDGKGVE